MATRLARRACCVTFCTSALEEYLLLELIVNWEFEANNIETGNILHLSFARTSL